MAAIKLVVCGMTGTTIHDNREVEGILFDVLQQTGLFVERSTVISMMGWDKRKVLETLWEQQIGKADPLYGERVADSYELFSRLLEKYYTTHRVKAADGATELFWHCRKKGIKVALVTSLHRKAANIILQKLNWLKGLDHRYISYSSLATIDCSVTVTEVQEGRPQPDMIWHAMQQLHIGDPGEVIHIGHTPADLLSAQKAGVRQSLAIATGNYSATQLSAYGSHGILNHVGELIPLLSKMSQ